MSDLSPAKQVLLPLANAIFELSHRRCMTPVLVTPAHVVLHPDFFVHLADAIWPFAQREIRFDWYRPVGDGLIWSGNWWASRRQKQINQLLCKTAAQTARVATMQLAAVIGRPGGTNREFVIGWSDEERPLPPWCVSIHLASKSRNDSINQNSVMPINLREVA